MRLQRIIFHRVGLWAEPLELELDERLTIILGDNEAGKSTAMRALDALLFGVTRELARPLAAAQFHAAVEALTPGGESLEWTRQGQRRIEDPSTEERLSLYLAPHQRTRFRSLFHLGHADISGDSTHLSADGALGSIIYAASTGVELTRVEALIKSLESRHRELRGSSQANQAVMHLLKELRAREDELNKAHRFDDYERLNREYEELEAAQEENVKSHEQLSNKLARLEERIRWAGLISERDSLKAEHKAHLGSRRAPGARWAEDLGTKWHALTTARTDLADRARERLEAQQLRDQLGPEPQLALYASELIALEKRSDDIRSAREKYARAQARLAQHRAALIRALELDDTVSTDALLSRARGAVLNEELRRPLDEAIKNADSTDEEIERAERTLRENERKLEALKPIPKLLELRLLEALEEKVAELAARERDRDVRRINLDEAEARANALKTKLGLGELEPDQLNALAIAPRERLNEESLALAEAQSKLSEAQSFERRLEDELAAARAALREEESKLGETPTEEQLEEARGARDRAWSALNQALRGELDERIEHAAQFEAAMRQLDRLLEHRFLGATRLGQLAEQRRALKTKEEQLSEARKDLNSRKSELHQLEEAWRARWPFLQEPPNDPARWLDELEELKREFFELISARERLSEESATIERALGELRQLAKGESLALDELSTAAALAAIIKAEIERREAHNGEASEAMSRAKHLADLIQDELIALEGMRERAAESGDRLRSLMEKLPEGAKADRDGVRAMLARQEAIGRDIEALEQAQGDALELERSIKSFESEAKKLLDLARALKDELSLPDELPLLSAIQAAAHAAGEAAERKKKIELAVVKLGELHSAEARAETAFSAAERDVNALLEACLFEGEPDDELIERAAKWAREAVRIETKLLELNDALRPLSEDETREIAATPKQALLEEKEDLTSALKKLDEERGERRERLKQTQARLEALGGSSPDALAQEREELREQLLKRAEEIAHLEAALFLLRSAQARAASAADPLIEEASTIFARLTGGRYEGILLSQDDQDANSALQAQPARGRALNLDELSDGTRDQIWLALRLATALRAHEETPLPLILDDILVHFDESRTAAALELFAELSERMQIILFTHHDHVAHQAAKAIPGRYSLRLLARPEQETKRLSEPRPSVERPAPMRARDLPRSGGASSEALVEEVYETLLEILRESPSNEFSKADLIELAEARGATIDDELWRGAANRMKEDPSIEITGRGRGTRYQIASEILESAETREG